MINSFFLNLFSRWLVGAIALTPFALYMAGFTAAGIAAGSVGAGLMSSAAVAIKVQRELFSSVY